MVSSNYNGLLPHLRAAEEAAWEAVSGKKGGAEKAHKLIAEALEIAQLLSQAPPCALPGCKDPVEYSGQGRPAQYCSRRCRDRAAYAARRQRQSSCMTDDDQDPVSGIS